MNVAKTIQYNTFENGIRGMCAAMILTHISIAVFCGTKAKSADPDQNAASDQGLHCLLAECSIKI